MKESLGNAMLFYIIITFVVVLIMFFVGSLSYSKAYKVKNKIIEEIEKEGETIKNPLSTQEAENAYARASEEIEKWLASGSESGTGIGYRYHTNELNNQSLCPSVDGGELVNKNSHYQYCVYRFSTCETNDGRCGIYYKVTTYMFFDIPVIGDLLKIPVSGETMIFTQINS